LYGYWTATPKQETGGRFGFGESLDGIRWTALAPPKVAGVGEGEVGAIEKIGGRYYMLYGHRGGMQTLVAGKAEGPFRTTAKNNEFLTGHTYFARFFPAPSGLLVCHHSIARDGQVYAGLLKGTQVDVEGTLRLTWWPGNEALKHKPVALPLSAAGGKGPIRMLGRKLDVASGSVLEGMLRLPDPLGAPRGLYIEHGKGAGTAVLFNGDGRTELGTVAADGSGFRPDKIVDRQVRFPVPSRFRLALKGVLLEVYLDDYLIECYSLPAPATGRIGLITGNHRHAISALKAWK
jgi:hypothetical protein